MHALPLTVHLETQLMIHQFHNKPTYILLNKITYIQLTGNGHFIKISFHSIIVITSHQSVCTNRTTPFISYIIKIIITPCAKTISSNYFFFFFVVVSPFMAFPTRNERTIIKHIPIIHLFRLPLWIFGHDSNLLHYCFCIGCI